MGEGAATLVEAANIITEALPSATAGGMVVDTTAPVPVDTVVAMAMGEGMAEVVVLQEVGMAPASLMVLVGCSADWDSEDFLAWLPRPCLLPLSPFM